MKLIEIKDKKILNKNMSSIVSYISELQSINQAIAENNKKNASLRKRVKQLEKEIADYLEAKDQPGVKFQNVAIVVEKKPKWTTKNKKEKEKDSLRILEDYGVTESRSALEDLMRVRKGEEFEDKKIKIKKIKY